jgi:peptidoglycan/LPS O-acetylase OafA/YrhL
VISTARVPSLDGLRGIAILLVLVLHATSYGGSAPAGALDRAVYDAARAGWVGVDLFFVLSGFLITGILLDTRRRGDFLRNFFTRRLLRIFPAYYAALLILLVLLPVFTAHPGVEAEARAGVWYWTYLANLRTAWQGWPDFGFIGHFWTLAVEEQFYLLWPFVVLAAEPRQLKRLCLILMVAALVLRLGLHAVQYAEAAYVLMPARVDTLCAGAWVAVVLREPGGLERAVRWARALLPIAATGTAALYIFADRLMSEHLLVGTAGYTVIAVLFASGLVLVLAAEHQRRPYRLLLSAPLMNLGKYSYAIYIVHHPPLFFLPDAWSIDRLAAVLGAWLPAQLLFVTAWTLGSLALAMVSWHMLEKHVLRLKDRWAPREATSPATDPAIVLSPGA